MNDSNSKNILVVDDDVQILMLFENIFSDEGFNVFKAANAQDALKILKNNSIPLIYLDLQMPKVTGIKLCEEIRKFNQLAWICAITGAYTLFEIAECRAVGFDDYFTKPLDMVLLIKNTHESFVRFNRWKQRKDL